MKYANLSSAAVRKHSFNSNDHVFRPTSLAEALQAAGVTQGIHFVREAKVEGIVRDRNDCDNSRSSVSKIFHVSH